MPKRPNLPPKFYNFLTAFLSFFGSFCPHCEGKFDRVPEACRYFTNYGIPTKRPLWSIEAKVQNKHDDLNAGSWVVCRLRSEPIRGAEVCHLKLIPICQILGKIFTIWGVLVYMSLLLIGRWVWKRFRGMICTEQV